MSADKKCSKPQISKTIQSRRSFGSWLSNLGKKPLTDINIILARNNIPWSINNLNWSAMNKFDRKTNGKRSVITGEGITLFICNKDINCIMKIINSLEHLGVIIDGVTVTVKHKKKEDRFFRPLLIPFAD